MYEIPDEKKSINQNVFEVKVPDGKVYKLPKFDYLSPRQAAAFDKADEDLQSMFDLLDEIGKPKGLGTFLFDSPSAYTHQLMDAWMKESGVSAGESETSEA